MSAEPVRQLKSDQENEDEPWDQIGLEGLPLIFSA
jgi:hypothetical protein